MNLSVEHFCSSNNELSAWMLRGKKERGDEGYLIDRVRFRRIFLFIKGGG